jgi:hypothetical protein
MTKLNYCYECRAEHWPSECPKRIPAASAYVQPTMSSVDVTAIEEPKVVTKREPITKRNVTKRDQVNVTEHNGVNRHCPTCRCFGPRTVAERQRAYRDRHKDK